MSRKPNSEIVDLADLLRPVKIGRNGYTKIDRFRDFSQVFYSEQGKRVLAQIMDLCEGPVTLETDLNNHAVLAARAWTRRMGHLIMAYATVPPSSESVEKDRQ